MEEARGNLGSINSWEQLGKSPFWPRWLGESLGRVHALLDAEGLAYAKEFTSSMSA